jgi:hypothetical protein
VKINNSMGTMAGGEWKGNGEMQVQRTLDIKLRESPFVNPTTSSATPMSATAVRGTSTYILIISTSTVLGSHQLEHSK